MNQLNLSHSSAQEQPDLSQWITVPELPGHVNFLQATPHNSQMHCVAQDFGQTQVPQISSAPTNNQENFLNSIYVLRTAFRHSCTPSTSEIHQLAQETGLMPFVIANWFDGERSQRDFWISQNGLPTPPTSRRFINQSFSQGDTSKATSAQMSADVPSVSQNNTMLDILSQGIVEPQSGEPSFSNRTSSTRQEQLNSRVPDLASNPAKRVKRQYRSRRSNEDRDVQESRTFGCPTCPSTCKSVDEWYNHQRRCHFPTEVWACRSSCKTPISKRRDNFRNHLKKAHKIQRPRELDAEVSKRSIKVTGLFHTKCGFCERDLATWEASMLHIWEHVERGDSMAEWNHVCGTDHELTANVHYQFPPEQSEPDQDSDDDDANDDDQNSGGSAGDKFDPAQHGVFDDFSLDPDLGGNGYDGGMGPGDGTVQSGSYFHHANLSLSGSDEIMDEDSTDSDSQSGMAANLVKEDDTTIQPAPFNIDLGSRAITCQFDLPHRGLAFNKETAAEALLDFEQALKKFTVSPTHRGGRNFVLTESLVDWLRSQWPEHTCSQAARLHKSVYYNKSFLFEPISVDQLSSKQNGCLLVFSILLVLERGALVDRFQRRGIVDMVIPMSLESLQTRIKEMDLSNADARKLAELFYEKQYLFCPVMIYRNMDRLYDKEMIIPTCQEQKINDKAGSATEISLIEVPEQFVGNDLKPGAIGYEDKNDGLGYRYQFALKTYRQSNQDLFENETQAFKALKDNKGMVQYLGEYTQIFNQVSGIPETSDQTTFNILLEYGELDLNEYFQERLPAYLPTEIMEFWKNLFNVAEALKGIHNLTLGSGEFREEYYGWHADIKPDNILCVKGEFKLADPGFAHFVRKKDQKPMGEIIGGTETYGAPEQFSNGGESMSKMHQTIDVWSFGCVLSEAATWLGAGYQGITRYRELREKARRSDGNISDAFHDGIKVLPVVVDWHKSLRSRLRKTDTVTSLVLDLVENEMLLSDPEERLSAEGICAQLGMIYKRAQAALGTFDDKIPEAKTKAPRQLEYSVLPKARSRIPSKRSSSNTYGGRSKVKDPDICSTRMKHHSEVFKPGPYEYQALGKPGEIRLFQLSPSADPKSNIRGSIIHTTISEESAFSDSETSYPSESPDCICCDPYHPSDAYSLEGGYTALSYAWGNPEKSSAVYIDGRRLFITVNLDQALRSLRLENKSPRLWVDSICINQESDQERNHQVRQMCSIYETATSTIIYLGPATELSTSCFKAAAAGPVIGSEIAQAHRWDRAGQLHSYPELGRGRDEILGRSWFTRAWTFQELVVSRRAWICCGTTCMPWSQLCSYFLQDRRWDITLGRDKWSYNDIYANCPMPDPWGLQSAVYGRYSIIRDPDSQHLQITTKGFMIMDKVRQIYHADPETRVRAREEDKYSLYTLLERRQGFAASELRDCVFSLYGVLDQNDSAIIRTPVDYQKSLVQIFTELAVTLLNTNEGHDYALFIHVENGRSEIDGLPTWVPNWAVMRKYDRSIRNYILDWTTPLFGSRKREEKSSDFKIYKEHSAIVCRGHHSLSRIVKLSPPVQLEDRWMNDWKVEARISVDESDSLAVTSGETSRYAFQEFSTFDSRKNDVRDLIHRQAECIPGRRFALLEDDELALVPEQARVEDQICALKGAKTFFTVRKVTGGAQSATLDHRVLDDFEGRISVVGHYHLIGECCKGDWKRMGEHTGPFDIGFMLY